jgi:mitochondrial GTPase 1
MSLFLDHQPFRNAMAKKFPGQEMLFASWQRPRDIRDLSATLVSMLLSIDYKGYSLDAYRLVTADIAKQHPHAIELNVLVIGMPNVGKSTLLNALRNMGIKGRTCPTLFSTFFRAM